MDSIKTYFSRCNNFGDSLSPMLVARITQRTVSFAEPMNADLLAVGSILNAGASMFVGVPSAISLPAIRTAAGCALARLKKPLKVWGSGFLIPRVPSRCYARRRVKLFAVRGAETLSILNNIGIGGHNVALGDPGLLYRDLLGKLPGKEFDVGVVPHLADAVIGRYYYDLLTSKGVRAQYIDVSGDPISVLADIARCEVIISSSLHGCIVADSFGIPNQHVVFSYLTWSKDDFLFKFKDYYSAFGEQMPQMLSVSDAFSSPISTIELARKQVLRSRDCLQEVSAKLKESLLRGVCEE